MRTLDIGFASHIASGATTLCTCWTITRTDGLVLGFTDHDAALGFDGVEFTPAHGLDGSEAPRRLGPQVDTGEVLGVLHADAISADDIALGRYDGASVVTWRVNWRDVSQRLELRRDTIGEIVREDGVFRAELRSGQHALNVPRGRVYSPLCDATLGDARCAVAVSAPEFSAGATVMVVRDRWRLEIAGLGGFEPGWFALGMARWQDGRRAGLGDQIVSHQRIGDADIFGFALAVGDWVAPGDALVAEVGCDRRLATCRDRFGNLRNFRGFPHIPGADFIMRYPREGDRRDGGALFR